jgi:hypothetical protein
MPFPKKAEVAQPVLLRYITSQAHHTTFDILTRGEMIRGRWNGADRSHVCFDVPEELGDAFERHYYFLSGRVIRDPEYVPPMSEQVTEQVAEQVPETKTETEPSPESIPQTPRPRGRPRIHPLPNPDIPTDPVVPVTE